MIWLGAAVAAQVWMDGQWRTLSSMVISMRTTLRRQFFLFIYLFSFSFSLDTSAVYTSVIMSILPFCRDAVWERYCVTTSNGKRQLYTSLFEITVCFVLINVRKEW